MPPVAHVTAGDVLRLAELNQLRSTSSLRGASLVAHAWATIFAAMAVYVLWPSALTLVVAVADIGSRQLGLFVLMHDASHWLLFRHHKVNSGVVKALRVPARGGSAGLPAGAPSPSPAHAAGRRPRPRAKGYGTRMEQSPGYFDVIRRATRPAAGYSSSASSTSS